MRGFFRFMASAAGRWTRIVAGAAIVLVGIFALGGVAGWVVAFVGLLPLAAGLFDFCLLATLVGLPFLGVRLRRALGEP